MTTQQQILEALLSGKVLTAVQSMERFGIQHNTYNKYINYIRDGRNQDRAYPVKTNMVYQGEKHWAEHSIEKLPDWYEMEIKAKKSYEQAGKTDHVEYQKICQHLKDKGYK